MHHTTRDVLGTAAYLRRSCEIVLGQLKRVDAMVVGTEQLTPIQEAAIVNAQRDLAERAKEHLELAGQYVDDWQHTVVEALSTEPSWLE
jgi:hypothetical protein